MLRLKNGHPEMWALQVATCW